jgi:hypothetical protein
VDDQETLAKLLEYQGQQRTGLFGARDRTKPSPVLARILLIKNGRKSAIASNVSRPTGRWTAMADLLAMRSQANTFPSFKGAIAVLATRRSLI